MAKLLLWCVIFVPTTVFGITLYYSDSTFYDKYPYIFLLEDGQEPPTLTDEEFFDRAASVIFPVSRINMPLNSPLLKELDQTLIPHINGDSLQLVQLVFRGAASPEGPVNFNRWLGENRMKVLYDYVMQRMAFPVPESMKNIDYDVEDYRSLMLMMRRANDPDLPIVEELCSRYYPNDLVALKRHMMGKHGGQMWLRLYATYFPQLRSARFVMFLRKVAPQLRPDSLAAVPLPVVPSEIGPMFDPPVLAMPSVLKGSSTEAIYEGWLPRREMLSIKTNLLFYAIYMPGYDRWCPIPNVAVEYYPKGGHFTFGASFDMPWWQDYDGHKYFQLRNYQLETRYYLKASKPYRPYELYEAPAFSGIYLQAYAHAGLYGICFDADRGWVGEGAGAGLGAGYVVPVSRNGHWRLELQVQAGFFRTKYDPYQYENLINLTYHDNLYYYKWTQKPSLFKKRQYRFNWLGPTRLGVTLTYDLIYRKRQRQSPTPAPSRRGEGSIYYNSQNQ